MSNPQNQPHPIDIVGHYLNNCTPPAGCTTAQAAQVIAAWNSLVQPIIAAEKAKAAAEAGKAATVDKAAPPAKAGPSAKSAKG